MIIKAVKHHSFNRPWIELYLILDDTTLLSNSEKRLCLPQCASCRCHVYIASTQWLPGRVQQRQMASCLPTYVRKSGRRPSSLLGATAAFLDRSAAIVFIVETVEVATVTTCCHRSALFERSKA